MPDTTPLANVILNRLRSVSRSGKGWKACCPAHEDTNPSLSVVIGDNGRALVHCFAGCPPESIVKALGLEMADLFTGPHRNRRQLHVVRPRLTTEAPPPDPKWRKIAAEAHAAGEHRIGSLAESLGVAPETLLDLRVGWLSASQVARLCGKASPAFTIPERDGLHRVVGVALRRSDGSKAFITGGRRGLVIPASVRAAMPSHLYAVEGMSDCAALLTAGKAAVARASCTAGARELFELLRGHSHTAITIVGDRDTPGQVGAVGVQCALQVMLKRPVGFALPPQGFKDMRAALIGGAL